MVNANEQDAPIGPLETRSKKLAFVLSGIGSLGSVQMG
jgi:hypothetical protein